MEQIDLAEKLEKRKDKAAQLASVRHTAGRPVGAVNKIGRRLKDDLLAAYEELGGVHYLCVIATEFPAVFCNLLGKVIPQQIKAEIGRPGDFDHLTDSQLDSEIVKLIADDPDLKRQVFDVGIALGGKEVAVGQPETDPVHTDDVTGLPGGTS